MTGVPARAAVAAAVAGIDPASLPAARWFGAKDRTVDRLELVEAFALPGGDEPAGTDGVLAVVRVHYRGDPPDRYLLSLAAGPAGVRLAPDDDPAPWRALALAVAEGRTIPALPRERDPATGGSPGDGPAAPGDGTASASGPVEAALVCRPAPALRALVPDGPAGVRALAARPLGADQSNTSIVLGEALLLKAYRRLQPGLNPELELVAYLSEEAGFPAVASLAGFVELVSARDGLSTVALLQQFVPDARDAYEWLAETLTGWLLAPGAVSVEYASDAAADLGTLTAALHAALATARDVPDFAPREATRDELRRWHDDARAQLDRALEVTPDEPGRVLRELAPAIAEELTVFEALARVPLLTRVHGDLHLGQILVAADGYRFVDFEGEPLRPLEERRAHRSPLRDVASMLRSLDHVGRSAVRRAERRRGGPLEAPGLDIEGWLVRARERFLDAYVAALRELGAPIDVDPALVRAFEIEKECYEFVYASTWLPEWLWAPTEGMRGLVGGAGGIR